MQLLVPSRFSIKSVKQLKRKVRIFRIMIENEEKIKSKCDRPITINHSTPGFLT